MNEVLDTVNKYGSLLRKKRFSSMSFGWLIAGAAIGVAATYLLDPNQGTQRRTALRTKASKFGTDFSDVAGKQFSNIREKVETAASSMGLSSAVDSVASKAEMNGSSKSSTPTTGATQASASTAKSPKSANSSTSSSSFN